MENTGVGIFPLSISFPEKYIIFLEKFFHSTNQEGGQRQSTQSLCG